MSRLTQADLERAVGAADGAMTLAELIGDATGSVNTDVLDEILAEVDEEANSYIGDAVNIADPVVDTSRMLLMKEKACAVYLCWLRGSRSQAMPDAVRQAREDSIQWYQDVRDRRASLGTTTKPATGQLVTQVTLQTDEPLVSGNSPRQRFKGMW